MSLYCLGISRKHYLTQDAATNAIKKKEEIIRRSTKYTDTLRGWKQGWELEKRPKLHGLKKKLKLKLKVSTMVKKKQKKKLLK